MLTLADRLLAVLLHYRLGLPQVAIARLFGVTSETINRRIRDIRQLLGTAGHNIHRTHRQLATLEQLYDHASAVGITVPLKIKTAS